MRSRVGSRGGAGTSVPVSPRMSSNTNGTDPRPPVRTAYSQFAASARRNITQIVLLFASRTALLHFLILGLDNCWVCCAWVAAIGVSFVLHVGLLRWSVTIHSRE